MAMTREYGYREYDDDLTPGRGGLSNLLYNEDGALTTHATFHSIEPEEESSDSSEETDRIELLIAAGVVVLAGVAVVGIRRAVRHFRVKRANVATPEDVTSEVEVDKQAALAGVAADQSQDSVQDVLDADDALIEEVKALCEESSATIQAYQHRRDAADRDTTANDSHTARPKKLRRRRS